MFFNIYAIQLCGVPRVAVTDQWSTGEDSTARRPSDQSLQLRGRVPTRSEPVRQRSRRPTWAACPAAVRSSGQSGHDWPQRWQREYTGQSQGHFTACTQWPPRRRHHRKQRFSAFWGDYKTTEKEWHEINWNKMKQTIWAKLMRRATAYSPVRRLSRS